MRRTAGRMDSERVPEAASTPERVPAASKSGPPPRWLQLLRKGWPAVAGLAVLVGLAGGLVQLSQLISTRTGDASTLKIEAGSVAYSLGDYAVPVDAPFDEFPSDLVDQPNMPGVRVCSEEQHKWLRRHGTPYVTYLSVSLRNEAESGGITVRDFKTKGEVRSPVVPLVAVRCIIPIGGAVFRQAGILPADNRSIAVWSDDEPHKGNPEVKLFDGGAPVAYDLDAGESAQLDLFIETPEDYLGAIEASVLAGDKSTTVRLDIVSEDEANEDDRILLAKFSKTQDIQVGIGAGPGYEEEPGKPFFLDNERYSAAQLQRRLSAVGH